MTEPIISRKRGYLSEERVHVAILTSYAAKAARTPRQIHANVSPFHASVSKTFYLLLKL